MTPDVSGRVRRSDGSSASVGPSVIAGNIDLSESDSRIHCCDQRTLVLPKVPPCGHCGAYKFYKETALFCCLGGEIHLAESVLPDSLAHLIVGTDKKSKEFHTMIRMYNNHFAFATIGMHCDPQLEHMDHGVYTVRVQGKVYHFLGDLLPHEGSNRLSGLQFYLYDTDHQVMSRMELLPRLDVDIVQMLFDVLARDPYSVFLKSVSCLPNVDEYKIVIRSDPGMDQRRYNQPTSSEVAVIWIDVDGEYEGNFCKWDIQVYTKSGSSCSVQCYYACYDPLQYPIMFPNGESGWHRNIPRTAGMKIQKEQGSRISTGEGSRISTAIISNYVSFDEVLQMEERECHARKRTTVSCRQYYVYKLQIREGDRSYILRFGRLLQQYIVENYIKIETMRLDFLRNNQDKLRIEHYQGVVDSVVGGLEKGSRVGKRIYLPATFIGGPRDMRHRYLDSMALVNEFGRPDIFLTMTCNPKWPEIKEMLKPGEEAHNRPDLLARVFKAKLGIMNERITDGKIFGDVASVVHVVEFQKRGLPHAHFLIILKPSSKYQTPEAYDRIVSAELPDGNKDPYLYSLLTKHMMHGPCGQLNSSNVCMRDGRCKNHYPKEFKEHTTHGKGSYAVYRRRDNRSSARVRGKDLDNRWVIPYNPTLLAEFNCHVNVEICCDIRAVKYLYKYVHKGHDKISFRIAAENSIVDIDEISNFQSGRWVSPVEAAWRIFGFPLSGMFPSVQQLQVHLLNFLSVQFHDEDDLQDILRNERNKRIMLMEFFSMNSTSNDAKSFNLLYKYFPRYFVWDSKIHTWTCRKRGVTIGRLCTVNPVESERYYLRLLLNNVRFPMSYQHLLTVDGIILETFQDAAHKRGLLQNDDDIQQALEEARIYKIPSDLRRLFGTLLHYCRPVRPRTLFNSFFEYMAEDFQKMQEENNISPAHILHKVLEGINDTLESIGRDINEFHLVPFKYTSSEFQRFTREIAAERNIPIPEEDLMDVHKLNTEQKNAFDLIFNKAMNDSGGMFFVDGPGGTGKSYLYKVLLSHIRSRGYIAIVVASSGISSSVFLGGRTAHSRFKIPIDGGANVKCLISVQSSKADLIRSSKIIIWDESPMSNKFVINALNNLLQELCENSYPFGGKLVVFGGDFRQVLPIIKGGSRSEQV